MISSLQLSTSLNSNGGSALDALPKQFIVSMKTLFDILDDQLTGFVKFSDIEKGWQDDVKGLPSGVIDSLRKVTPASGLLSFERFCSGLKLCLLRNQVDIKANLTKNGIEIGPPYGGQNSKPPPSRPARPPSASNMVIENSQSSATWGTSRRFTPTPEVLAHNMMGVKQRAWSMPQLSPDSELESELSATDICAYNVAPPPPKPPRANAVASENIILTPTGNSTTDAIKPEMRRVLQNWQMSILLNEMDSKDKCKSRYVEQQSQYRGSADGGSSSATDSGANTAMALNVRKFSSKRREPRRHTLQNGIDYNMLKRLKQLEEQREVVLLRLEAVEKAHGWYLQQLSHVQEKIKYLGRMGTNIEQWSEGQQERIHFQRARVLEVNRSLAMLADTWERGGFPFQYNLSIPSLPTPLGLRQAEQEGQMRMRDRFNRQQHLGLDSNMRDMGFIHVLSQSLPMCSSLSGGLGDADVVF